MEKYFMKTHLSTLHIINNIIYFRLNNLLQEISSSADFGAKTIIFVETKKKVENVTKTIKRYGWPAVCMHGDKSQQERDYVLREFRNGRASILVATDVAARGLGRWTEKKKTTGRLKYSEWKWKCQIRHWGCVVARI